MLHQYLPSGPHSGQQLMELGFFSEWLMATVSVDETLQVLFYCSTVESERPLFVMSDDSFKANQSLHKET